VLKMLDEAGGDDKVVAVLAKDPRWAHIQDVDDLDEWTKGEIGHFFEHYKDLEPGKWVKVDQWADAEEAERLVAEAFQRFQDEGAQTATQGEATPQDHLRPGLTREERMPVGIRSSALRQASVDVDAVVVEHGRRVDAHALPVDLEVQVAAVESRCCRRRR
jgi:hypothetical protein